MDDAAKSWPIVQGESQARGHSPSCHYEDAIHMTDIDGNDLEVFESEGPGGGAASASKTQDVVSSFIVLYGITLTMLGVVIPVCDGLASGTLKHQTYDQAFYLYMHTVGLAFLGFFSFVIYKFKEPLTAPPGTASGTEDSGRQQSNHLQLPPQQQQQQQQASNGGPSSSSLGSPGLQGAEGSARDETSDAKEGASLCAQLRRRLRLRRLRLQSLRLAEGVAKGKTGDALQEQQEKPPRMQHQQHQQNQQSSHCKRASPGVWMSAEGINLYMRLGVIIFGFGVMIHDAFKLADTFEQPNFGGHCRSNLWQMQLLVHLVFILLQTFHLFKSHRVVVSVYPSAMKFAFAHLIVTNLCIWMKAVIYEVKMALTKNLLDGAPQGVAGPNGTAGNSSAEVECAMALASDTATSHSLSPFLYPCAVEYGLISAAICFKLFKKVGTEYEEESCRYDLPRPVRSFKFFTTCHKSHKGLFFGLLIVILIVVPLATLVLLPQRDQQKRDAYTIVVLSAECSVLFITMVMCCLGSYRSINHLTLTSRDVHLLDVNLLFVGLAGLLCYNLFVVVSSASCLVDEHHDELETDHCLFGSGQRAVITKLNGLKSFLDGAQALSQAFLIVELARRKLSRRLFLQGRKPARGILIGLLVANLAMWVAAVFESKRHISVEFHENYFGKKAWKIIKYTTLPMIIFFRFHSTVCLSEIWKGTYCHKAQQTHSTSCSQSQVD